MQHILSEKGPLFVLYIFKMKKQHLGTEKNRYLELYKVLAEGLERAISFQAAFCNTVSKMLKATQNVPRSKM